MSRNCRYIHWMFVETQNSEVVLTRFNKLLQELVRGSMTRNTFQPWEIEILLDIEACNLRDAVRRETLRRYQKAVQRAMERGAPVPLRLSEYLNGKKSVSVKSA
jgi:hypothetical protein